MLKRSVVPSDPVHESGPVPVHESGPVHGSGPVHDGEYADLPNVDIVVPEPAPGLVRPIGASGFDAALA